MEFSKNSSNSSMGKSGNTKQISPAKHWVFTLNNHSKDDIDIIMKCSSTKRVSMQEETGEAGTPHLQGYIEFVKKVRPISVFKSFKAHWEKCNNIKASIEYTQKEDTRTGKQFMKAIRKIRKVKVLREDQLFPWQREILKITEEEPDDRTIHWYWDKKGNVGKSALVKYLVVNHGAMLISGKSADIKYQIATVKNKEYPDIILYDIPRTSEGYINYSAMEEIKNGVFASSKYESQMIIMPSPHIICFANFEPNLDSMSKDRWKVTKLRKPKSLIQKILK